MVRRLGATHLHVIGREPDNSAPVNGANRQQLVKDRVRLALARLSDWAGLPGAVRPIQYDDPLTGNFIEVSVRGPSTVLSVNGRDYAFDRLSGRFTGTGTGCL